MLCLDREIGGLWGRSTSKGLYQEAKFTKNRLRINRFLSAMPVGIIWVGAFVNVLFWWVLISILLILPMIVRRWLRLCSEKCLECGYNLTGNVSGVCPECGKAVTGGAVSSQHSAVSEHAVGADPTG